MQYIQGWDVPNFGQFVSGIQFLFKFISNTKSYYNRKFYLKIPGRIANLTFSSNISILKHCSVIFLSLFLNHLPKSCHIIMQKKQIPARTVKDVIGINVSRNVCCKLSVDTTRSMNIYRISNQRNISEITAPRHTFIWVFITCKNTIPGLIQHLICQ